MDTLTYFRTLFRGCAGWLEIRLVHEDGRPPRRRHFALSGGLPAAVALCQAETGRAHVFFGVYTRDDTRGRSDSVASVQGLYADLDAEVFPGGADEIDRRLDGFGWPPTVVVNSGSGRHGYWLFYRPVPLQPAHEGSGDGVSPSWMRRALWAVADALGVPPERNTVHDLARLLRVPGSTNIKPKYPRPLPCTVLLALPERRYDPGDFRKFAEAARARRAPRPEAEAFTPLVRFGDGGRWAGRSLDEVLAGLRLAPHTVRLIREGAAEGVRSERCQRAITALLAAGCDPDRVVAVLTHPEAGLADKYRDEERHGNGDRWLARSIDNAMRYLDARNPAWRPPWTAQAGAAMRRRVRRDGPASTGSCAGRPPARGGRAGL